MAVMTLPRSEMMNRAFMRRALWLSILLHVVGFGVWLQHWHAQQRHYEMPGRFTVVMQSQRAASPPQPVAPPRVKPAAPRSKPKTTPVRTVPVPADKPGPRARPVPDATPVPSPARRETLPDRSATAQLAWVPPRVAAYIDNPKPYYPRMARRRGMEGRVELRVRVGVNGEVTAIEILHSSGYRLLDQAAVETVQGWRFEPARRGGEAGPGEVVIPIRFSLRQGVETATGMDVGK
jgi:protein TonB